jgi:acyl-CoA synthetase (AMP-forming)/AMP-acid ligase II
VASIAAREVLEQTAALTALGRGTCVGRPFPRADVRIIAITDDPLPSLEHARELPVGEIGEIIVRSPSVTREYYLRPEATRAAKVPADAASSPQPPDAPFYHRMGDVGYLDAEGRLWFCGRKAHIVRTEQWVLYSVCCEAIFDEHPAVYRTALVGLGAAPRQTPVLVVEPEPGCFPAAPQAQAELRDSLLELGSRHDLTRSIQRFLFHRSLPVDTRHNVKINREALREWAADPQ